MQLTYEEALASIIEHTEIGYTIASQDRLWIVFIFDLWSEGKNLSLKYNRLYQTSPDFDVPMSYEMVGLGRGRGSEGCLVWTTRAEAEHFAERWRAYLAGLHREGEMPEVYVMNLGDDARYEATIIGRNGTQPRTAPKFKGSEKAWEAMAEMSRRWAEEVSPHVYE